MAKFIVTVAMATLWLGGCASVSLPNRDPAATATTPAVAQPNGPQRYRCDQAIAFTVSFADDTAVVDAGPRGKDVLLRDAGGATPQQTVYSNPRMRAEFGLGVSGREAMLRYAAPPLATHCVQE